MQLNAPCMLVVVLAIAVKAHIRMDKLEVNVESNYKPSFIRSAIESIPLDTDARLLVRNSAKPEFGDVFLPLRSAVESIPTPYQSNTSKLRQNPDIRSFVRDSIESLPNVEDGLEHMELSTNYSNGVSDDVVGVDLKSKKLTQNVHVDPWSISDKYASFIDSGNLDDIYPKSYRAGSPHQELLKMMNVEPVKHVDKLDRYAELQSYGVLGQSNLQQSYGALGLVNRNDFKVTTKVLCYMSNWAFYRSGEGHFVPEQIDPKLCSAIIYSFASLDPDHLTIREFDSWVDLDNQYYRRVTSLGVPVLIALGGWTDSSGSKYSRLVSDKLKRRVFASSVSSFLMRHGFSGLHLDWNYPKCWQSDCSRGPATDRPNLTKLLRELRTEFQGVNPKFQLGVAISGYKEIITEAYDFPALSDIVDYMTVMTYDYHGAWEQNTGHVSPLYGLSTDTYPQYNTNYTMQLLLKMGARREKLVLSIPFYGQSFTLAQKQKILVGPGVAATGPGAAGELTKQPGMLAYYEICQRLTKFKWMSDRDLSLKFGPYAMLNDQWVGYEDPTSAQAKARYAANNNFAGVAAWTVDLDDFRNLCCSESYPLLRAINRELGRLESKPPAHPNCKRPTLLVTPMPPQMTTISSDGSGGLGQNHGHTTSSLSWEDSSSLMFSTTKNPNLVSTTATSIIPWWSSTTKRPREPTMTTARPTPTTIPVPAVIYPVVQPSNCKSGDFYADSNNCNAYYHCVTAGELRQQFCPGGLHWNNEAKGCDWPSSARCSHKLDQHLNTSYPKPIKTSKKPETKPSSVHHQVSNSSSGPQYLRPTILECNEGEYYPHRNCRKYYICVNKALVPSECDRGLQWDGIKKLCDWPENVQCVTIQKYFKIIQSSSANEEDPCKGEERVPYPGNCSKYLFCLWNRLQASDCPPGLHYNEVIGNCDWPSAAKCDPKGGESSGEADMNAMSKPPTSQAPSGLPRPTYPTEKPVPKPLSSHYKVICYFTNWAWYRKGIGRYTPDDINTDLCTHIIYGFAVLDHSELILRTHDSWADVENSFYTRVSSLKGKGIKVSLALGGWNDSQGDKYSRLVRSPVARARFVRHALEFIEKYGFEGLDLDWEYPVCWQTECHKGSTAEKEGFTAWVQELSDAFRPRGLLLSTAVSPSRKIIDAGYDVQKLSRYFDWIAVMTYDFHGHWDKKTGHVAPLYHHPDDDFEHFNVNSSINYWIEKGAPSQKLVMGIPLYGQSFTLENINSSGLNAKAPRPGEAGEFTRAAGFLAYYEICERVNRQGWQVVHDEFDRMGPYAYKGTQWVSYDSPYMVRKKAYLARSLNLGGGMVWALDLDDFRNRCGNGVHPLLSEIHKVLKDTPSSLDKPAGLVPIESKPIEYPGVDGMKPESGGEDTEMQSIESVMQSTNDKDEEHELLEPLHEVDPNNVSEEEHIEASDMSTDFKIVCYFTNWAWYRQGGGKFLPEDIDADLCTHIIYGFAVLSREKLTIQPHDSWADLDNKFYERIVAYRKKGVKVTVAIGGWNDSAGDKYSRLVTNPEARSRFVRNILKFIEEYNFDGLDLDWEYPVCWQVDCKKGSADERTGFTALVRELFYAFQPKGLILSAAVSPNKKVIDAGYEVAELSYYFSWISVMAYDYHGQWDKKTGHVAPMYAHPEGTVNFNANFSMNYWISKGADRRKLVMGMPLYGQSFSLAETSNHQLNAPTYGGGEAGEATRARGFLAYYEICLKIRHHRWNVVRDTKGRMGPFAYHGDQWVSFDDAPMIRHKSEYIKAMGLGGAMIWALDLDDFKNVCGCETYPLLKAINRVLRGFGGPHSKCWLEQRKNTMKPNDDSFRSTINAQPGPNLHSGTQNLSLNVMSIKCRSKNYLPHERDCTKYYICDNGTHEERSCPEGLQWNKNFCDWPNNVQCPLRSDQITQKPPIHSSNPTNAITEPLTTNNAYKVVCYFTNWAWYRPSQGKYVPEDIDANLCTHIIYSFAVLDSNSLTIETDDSWTDIDNRFYERVVKYKKRGIRVMLAIGGWNDSMGNKYSRLVLDSQSRKRFVASVISFVEQYGFEGLDLAWEFPVCWQVDCDKGNPTEKEGFVALVKELSQAFKAKGLILSAAVSPSKMVIDAGYKVSELSPHFDWLAVMTYDFHGHWVMRTGHASPLFHKVGDADLYLNGNFSIHYWLARGIPREKLVMGMPMYGQTFTLADPNRRSLNDKTVGPGKAGTLTRANGFLAYYEICEKVGNGDWEVVRDEEGIFGTYAYSGNQWISYDDVRTIRRKAQFIKSLQLGGGMIWALDLDDFRGICGCGKHPLLRTLNQELLGLPGQKAKDCT